MRKNEDFGFAISLAGYRPGQMGYAEFHRVGPVATAAVYDWLGLDAFKIESCRISSAEAVKTAEAAGIKLCCPELAWEVSSQFDCREPLNLELNGPRCEANAWRRWGSYFRVLTGWNDPMATSMHPRLHFEAEDLSHEIVLRPAGWTKLDAVKRLGKRYVGPGYYPIAGVDVARISGCAHLVGEDEGVWYVVTR